MKEQTKSKGILKPLLYLCLIIVGLFFIVEIMDGIDNVISLIPRWFGVIIGIVVVVIITKFNL